MAANGLDPALIAYAGAAIAFVALIKLFLFQKKSNEAIEAAKKQEADKLSAIKAAAEKATEAEILAAEKLAAEKSSSS